MKRKKILSILVSLFLIYANKSLSKSEGYSKDYNNGTVYIGNQEYLQNIEKYSSNDILVLDARDEKDPDMKVLASSLINNPQIQKEILEILLEYEEQNPSLWNRTLKSMQIEWYFHNIMALFSYKIERTYDVDFNNDDEEKYNCEYWKRKILK